MLDDADIGEVNFFDPTFLTDSNRLLDEAREKAGVARCPFGAMVLGHKEVAEAFRSEKVKESGGEYMAALGVKEGPFTKHFANMILMQSGEKHTRLRRMVNGVFTPKQAAAARPMMREVATELLAPSVAQGTLDMVEVAELYAAQIFCRLVGLPTERVHTIRGLAGTMHRAMDENIVEIIGELDEATEGVIAYAVEMLERHKIDGGADLITSLLSATYEDDKLSEDELLNLTTVLLTASFGTVATEILWGIKLFTERPDLLKRLYDEPESIPRFVTELLRTHGSAASMTRVAGSDVDIDGVTVPAGTVMILSMRAACRDPKAYEDPATFDMDRDDASPLLTFGWGSHYCLGMHIGRAEVETFVAEFVQRVGEVRMAGELGASAALGLHAVHKLPVELIPRAHATSTTV